MTLSSRTAVALARIRAIFLFSALLSGCSDDIAAPAGPADGAAVPDAACEPAACSEAPPPQCVDEGRVRRFEGPGRCEKGACVFDAIETACNPARCADGVAIAADRCTEGRCEEGKKTVCPFGCSGDRCAADPCAGVSCDAPPAAACADAATARRYDAAGTCAEGTCRYASTDTPCAPASCENGVATAASACEGGRCVPGATTRCAFGCSGAACAADPCAGVACTTPPAPTCAGTSVLRTFAAPGTCAGGTCTFTPTETACAPARCENGVARAASTCAGGACVEGAVTSCAFGCDGAFCAGDPCAGTSCNTPPPSTCASETVVRSFPSGTCAAGECRYAPVERPCAPASCVLSEATTASRCSLGRCEPGVSTSCAFGCSGDRCAPDPCADLSCTTPPRAGCVDASTLRTYASRGVCTSGVCQYTTLETPCGAGRVCIGAECLCVPENDAQFCARMGTACGPTTGLDNCNTARSAENCGTCAAGRSCTAGGQCANDPELGARTAALIGEGLSDCGQANDVCARSTLVPGDTFFRGTDDTAPATIASFRLDRYEVSVGRFRRFVNAWLQGWRPAAGSGKHTHLNGGQGLALPSGGFEAGWSSTWSGYIGAPSTWAAVPSGASAATGAAWESNLRCNDTYAAWSAQPGALERKPMNCLSWYDAYAFCIWDGGFLPSEAEWEFAAAGGAERRAYPWGATSPNADLAAYECFADGDPGCSLADLLDVGSKPLGAARFGHRDLAGNVTEWAVDGWIAALATPCVNCSAAPSGDRVVRGQSFVGTPATMTSYGREYAQPAYRSIDSGVRCARPAP